MTKQKPELGKEVKTEVKGYGCLDDCKEYLPNMPAMPCGWNNTPKDSALW